MLKNKNEVAEMDEEISVGGGHTGVSKVPGPIVKGDVHSKRPQDKDQGDKSPVKLKSVGHDEEEETSSETNVKPTGDMAGKNKSSVSMKASDASAKTEELLALFGDDLSEEFVETTTVLFNEAIDSRVAEITEQLEEAYSQRLDEEIDSARDAMLESMDKYLSYAVTQWIEENKVAVETSLRSEIAEEFIEGLKGLFNESYIDVPQDKVDVIAEMTNRIEELESLYNAKTDEVIELQGAISEARAAEVLDQMTEGLAVTQAEKLKTLCEGLSFTDEASFAKKVQVIKESYFSSDRKSAKMLTESFDAGTYDEVEAPSGSMGKYVNAIRRTAVK